MRPSAVLTGDRINEGFFICVLYENVWLFRRAEKSGCIQPHNEVAVR